MMLMSRPHARLPHSAFHALEFFDPIALARQVLGDGGSPVEGVQAQSARVPSFDVIETADAYTLHVDLAGVAKEDVRLSVQGRKLSLQASRVQQEQKDGERTLFSGRSKAGFALDLRLSSEVDQSQAVAKMDNGVLTLNLPKRGAQAAHIAVN